MKSMDFNEQLSLYQTLTSAFQMVFWLWDPVKKQIQFLNDHPYTHSLNSLLDAPDVIDGAPECMKKQCLAEDHDKFMALFTDLENGKDTVGTDIRTVSTDGEITWLHYSGHAVRDDAGRLVKAWFCGQDISHRKKLEAEIEDTLEQLQDVQKIYTFALEGAQLFLWRLDLVKDEITFADNPFTLKRKKEIGYPDLVPHASKYILANVMPESIDTMKGIFADVHAGKPFTSGNIRFRAGGDQGYTLCHISYSTVCDESGKPVMAYGCEQNITDQVLMNDLYTQAKARFDSESGNDIIYRVHASLTNNEAFAIIPDHYNVMNTGSYDAANAIDFLTKAKLEDGTTVSGKMSRHRLIDQYVKGERHFTFDYRRPESMNWSWIRAEVTLVQNPDTSAVELFCYCRDISKDKTQSLLVETLTTFVYDNIGLIHLPDGAYIIQTRNGTYEGDGKTQSYHDWINNVVNTRVPDDVREDIRPVFTLSNILEGLNHDDIYIITTVEYDDNGERRNKLRQYAFADEARTMLFGYVLDVTASVAKEKKQADDMRQALAAARQASTAKTEFLSRMSHDIRTPMNAIIGFSTLLLRDADDPDKVRDEAGKVLTSSKHLLGLINDVLDMSKIESGKTDIVERPFSLKDTIATIDAIMRPQMTDKHQTFTIRAESLTQDHYIADSDRLQQILINILSNATKYTQEYGDICLDITALPQSSDKFATLRFSVKDNGQGMSEEYLKILFEPFTREWRGSEKSVQGTGLGMAITKNLIDLMGGKLHVTSKENAGSTFTFVLPMRLAKQSDTLPETTPKAQTNDTLTLDSLTILAAEDNELNAELLIDLMEDEGAKTTVVPDGQAVTEAFKDAPADTYQLILMDIQMPVMNGYDAARAIRRMADDDTLATDKRQEALSIPIIAMTANAFSEDVALAMDAGMNAHVAKPIDIDTLIQKISTLLM